MVLFGVRDEAGEALVGCERRGGCVMYCEIALSFSHTLSVPLSHYFPLSISLSHTHTLSLSFSFSLVLGCVNQDIPALGHKRIERPMFPLEQHDFEWVPHVSVFGTV